MIVTKERYDAPKWNKNEIARYARADIGDSRIAALIEECIGEAAPILDYRVCYTVDHIECSEGFLRFCGIAMQSSVIAKAVGGCESLVLFAATVGAPLDRLIAKYSRLEPSKALILQALGAERIESLCDAFCMKRNTELSQAGKSLRTRVSPGYGDIPLAMQEQVFKVLDCERKIGLTLSESLLMSPSKSVTALAGIGVSRVMTGNQCDNCQQTDCIYRN